MNLILKILEMKKITRILFNFKLTMMNKLIYIIITTTIQTETQTVIQTVIQTAIITHMTNTLKPVKNYRLVLTLLRRLWINMILIKNIKMNKKYNDF